MLVYCSPRPVQTVRGYFLHIFNIFVDNFDDGTGRSILRDLLTKFGGFDNIVGLLREPGLSELLKVKAYAELDAASLFLSFIIDRCRGEVGDASITTIFRKCGKMLNATLWRDV